MTDEVCDECLNYKSKCTCDIDLSSLLPMRKKKK